MIEKKEETKSLPEFKYEIKFTEETKSKIINGKLPNEFEVEAKMIVTN